MARSIHSLNTNTLLSCFMLASVLLSTIYGVLGITCIERMVRVTPCVPYVTLGGGIPPACCEGIQYLYADYNSKTQAQRQACCNCLKNMAAAIPLLKQDLVDTLPAKCGAPIPFNISATVDCSKVA